MSHQLNPTIAVIGIDIGKNSFHVVGLSRKCRYCCKKTLRTQTSNIDSRSSTDTQC
jgi:hypothetical protein